MRTKIPLQCLNVNLFLICVSMLSIVKQGRQWGQAAIKQELAYSPFVFGIDTLHIALISFISPCRNERISHTIVLVFGCCYACPDCLEWKRQSCPEPTPSPRRRCSYIVSIAALASMSAPYLRPKDPGIPSVCAAEFFESKCLMSYDNNPKKSSSCFEACFQSIQG